MIRPRVRPPVALLALLLLAGCAPSGGGGGVDVDRFEGDEKLVAETLDDLSSAGRRDDAEQICSRLLSARLVEQLGARRCVDVVGEQIEDAQVFDLEVDRVTVTGDRATARVVSDFDGEEQPRTVTLVREGGRFKLDAIAR